MFDQMTRENLEDPLIARSLFDDCTSDLCKMALVFNHDGLNMLIPSPKITRLFVDQPSIQTPMVLQEFVNDGGVIFTVYVVREYVKCVKCQSLSDGPKEKLIEQAYRAVFLSFRDISDVNRRYDNRKTILMQIDEAELPPPKLMIDIALGLREAMKIDLFKFDMIRDIGIGRN
ncbi:hypothetical protein ACFE04_028093 [Oxalis oulophora]